MHERALAELSAGRKHGHWMWFVFPQIAGLGSSSTARRYAISGVEEARAYLADEVLARRLHDCADALLGLSGDPSPEDVLGSVDALKLRSSMTLFAHVAAPGDDTFTRVLERFYAGEADARTLRTLRDA